jgi:hypothetical protein
MAVVQTGELFIVFIVTFSDDGVTEVPEISYTSRPVKITFQADNVTGQSVPLPYHRLTWRLPEAHHKYMKVSWAVLGSPSVQSWNMGATSIYLTLRTDTETHAGDGTPIDLDIG